MESSTLLPNKLCIHCSTKTINFIPFLQLCKDSDRKWKKMIELLDIPSAKHNVYVLISDDCQKRELLNFSKNKAVDRKGALKQLKQRLVRSKLDNIRHERERQLKLANVVTMSCPECAKPFFTVYKLNKHMKNVRKKMCPDCNVIVDIEDYKCHAATHGLDVYCCDICHECFERKRYYLMHKLKHTRGKHVCPECKLSFSSVQKFYSHLSRHKRCVCSTCKKKFSNKNCFLNHARSKVCAESKDLSVTKFICDYCSKVYNSKTAVKMHIKVHHLDGLKYQCDKCGKTFSNKAHLEEHGNTHEKVFDRFVCECGMNYSTRRGYQRHVKKHLKANFVKIKPRVSKASAIFHCNQCNDSFSDVKDFKTHLRHFHSNFDLNLEPPAMEIEVISIE